MKALLKCGSESANQEAENFFLENILLVLDKEIAIEWSPNKIHVWDKTSKKQFDPTVEVVVELSPEAIDLALDTNVSVTSLMKKIGKFLDEAMAIRKLAKTDLPFSIEFYSCCHYKPSTKK